MIANLLDRPIAFHRSFITIGTGVTGALMLSQALYWSTRTQNGDGWFYKTQSDWESETGLSRWEQESARKKLKKIGVMEEAKRGVPCKTYYRVNMAALESLLFQYVVKPQTSMRENLHQDSGDAAGSVEVKPQSNTETTAETTAETTNIDCEKASDADLLGAGKKTKKKPARRATKLNPETTADQFPVTESHRKLAADLGVSLDHELPQFIDYHLAKGSSFKDWGAALRTWIRNAHKFQKGSPGGGSGPVNGYMRQESHETDYWEGVNPDGTIKG